MSQKVFNILSNDNNFLSNIHSSILNIIKDGRIDITDVPDILLIISQTLFSSHNFNLNNQEIELLIKLIINFIIDKYNLIPNESKDEFNKIIDTTTKLIILNPVFKKSCSWFCCKKSNNNNNNINTNNEPRKTIELRNNIQQTTSQQTTSQQTTSQQTTSEQVKSEEVKVEEVKVEQTKSEEVKVEQNKPEEVKVEQTKPEEVKVEEVKVEEVKVEEVKVVEEILAM